MTDLQKQVLTVLLEGGTIAFAGKRYRVRSASAEPLFSICYNTLFRVKQTGCLRKKGGLLILDKRKVRRLHGNDWLKRQYKSLHQSKKKCVDSK